MTYLTLLLTLLCFRNVILDNVPSTYCSKFLLQVFITPSNNVSDIYWTSNATMGLAADPTFNDNSAITVATFTDFSINPIKENYNVTSLTFLSGDLNQPRETICELNAQPSKLVNFQIPGYTHVYGKCTEKYCTVPSNYFTIVASNGEVIKVNIYIPSLWRGISLGEAGYPAGSIYPYYDTHWAADTLENNAKFNLTSGDQRAYRTEYECLEFTNDPFFAEIDTNQPSCTKLEVTATLNDAKSPITFQGAIQQENPIDSIYFSANTSVAGINSASYSFLNCQPNNPGSCYTTVQTSYTSASYWFLDFSLATPNSNYQTIGAIPLAIVSNDKAQYQFYIQEKMVTPQNPSYDIVVPVYGTSPNLNASFHLSCISWRNLTAISPTPDMSSTGRTYEATAKPTNSVDRTTSNSSISAKSSTVSFNELTSIKPTSSVDQIRTSYGFVCMLFFIMMLF